MTRPELQMAEIPYDGGGIRFRYERYLASSGDRWMRHGLFRAYHRSGKLATEGQYRDGVEEGVWTDFHDNGVKAAEGEYRRGKEHGRWRFWNAQGEEERSVVYREGVVVGEAP